ncbi:MAG: putative Ig domain-containing protein, partial [Microcystaceae cyanobacterium]
MTTTTSHIEQEISLQVTADVTTSRTLLDPDHTLFPTVTVVSNYSYVADEASGLQIIDITVVNEPSDFTGDDFDPNLDSTQWDQIDNGTVNQQFVGSDGNSLFFDGSGQRQATTTYLDLSGSDNILVFDFIYGDGRNGGENADLGDEVVLEYTTDGVTWSAINTYDTFNYSQFTTLVEVIPDSATQLRWRQINHFGVGYDHWGLDNIALVSPTDNNAPTVLNPIGDQTAIEGLSFSLLLPSDTFADLDPWDTSLSYNISGLPNGLSFDSTTQTINGIATELGTFNVTITATDLVGATVDDTFDLTVNSPLPNAIEGTVWQDSNQNGIKDNDEAGLSQWTVYLDQNRNHQLDNGEIVALTDSNGHYRFDNLLPGTYYVEEVLPNNWQINYPYNTFNSANSTNSTSINNDSLNTASNTTQNLNFVLSGDYASHQVIIKFTSEITNDPELLSQIQEELGVTSIEQLTETGIELWSLENMTAEEAITTYYDHALIEYIEPNKEISVNSIMPNDPKFSSLWGFNNIDAPEAWQISTESPNIIIGFIDTGVDNNQPDLVNNIWKKKGEIAVEGIDNDGNGYIDDIHG